MVGEDIGSQTISKVRRRLMPFLVLMFFMASLDRSNLGVAALQMNKDLSLSDTVYALGAAIFFIPYAILEIPSNLFLHRIGARRWLARIMVTWGIIATAMAFVVGPNSFYLVRFLLGVAEAGFFPGVVLYITLWFPEREKAAMLAVFLLGLPLSLVFVGPVSGSIMALGGGLGFNSWQWMFILQGVPAVIIGVVAYFYLTDRPADARWLQPAEREWLSKTLASERDVKRQATDPSVQATLLNPKMLILGGAFFCVSMSVNGLTLWLPQIIKALGTFSVLQASFLSGLPYLCAAVAIILNGRHSDTSGERRYHIAIPCIVGAIGLAGSATFSSPPVALFFLCIAAMGIVSAATLIWTLPTAIVTEAAAAAAVALINCIGNLGGFFGPFLIGWVKQWTNGFAGPLYMLAAFLLVGAVIVITQVSSKVVLAGAPKPLSAH